MALDQTSLNSLEESTLAKISSLSSIDKLDELRRALTGKKGELTALMKGLRDAPPEHRKDLGARLNKLKQTIEAKLDQKSELLRQAALNANLGDEWLDYSLPVSGAIVPPAEGSQHPLSMVQRELEEIFRGLGFTVVDGPELEDDYHNFEALNIPETHPARDMQDTFFTKCANLLRTHTSSIQVRSLERMKPPLRIVAPGRCFRYERLDSSHEHTFYQMEGMMIDREVTVGHLIYFMRTLLREIFGFEQKIRLRPGYFPFVEPGFELDVWFQGRWLELLPCGLVHPKVLEFGGIDPKEWSGFAFGLGLSRLVMTRFEIDDIRHLQGADLRFLRQFS